jgi:2-oxoglutarate dehydrogenase E2 component (dihydrolipoamide succinyltransferase)
MPQLGESVTEGTVTRWLKKEGERVEADEPLLEVSTDKVDTEIPSPVAGILRGITVAEDETVEVGAELAVIDEDGAAPSQPAAPAAEPAPAPSAAEPSAAAQAEAPVTEPAAPPPPAPAQEQPAAAPQAPDQYATQQYQQQPGYQPQYQPGYPSPPTYPPQAYISPETYPQQAGQEPTQQGYAGTYQQPGYEQPSYPPQAAPAEQAPPAQPAPPAASAAPPAPAQEAPAAPAPEQEAPAGPAEDAGQVLQPTAEGPYVTPLVRKLASEHGIDLATVTGTGVGGRIRKQDVLDAARSGRGTAAAPAPAAAAPPQQAAPAAPAPAEVPSLATPTAPATTAPATTAPATTGPAAADGAPATNGRSVIVPSRLRGTTEQMSRARQVIAKRMVESLHVSAQLTTVVEADVTEIARLRDRAKAAFAAREGVKLSFLPFFALATVEALKIHPKLNAVIDTESNQVTYHDAEHLGIAVDTERGLMVPVIRKAGDLNIGGLARKIADLADRTRAGRVSPDDLSGGTFTLTNTGSRGALFDTPIINQPQVGILGTGTVVKRPVVVEDPALGEVITVRSMVYLALTYDHRLVDGADAARFLVTVKDRLEEGDFAAELGL